MSKLTDIKAHFVAALQAINGTGGYVNTIATIDQPVVNKLAEVSKGAAEVWVHISGKRNTGPNTRTNRIRTATIEVIGQLQIPLDATSNDAIYTLDDDIERAIGALIASRVGGHAVFITPTGTKFFDGDGVAQLVATVEVQYVDQVTP